MDNSNIAGGGSPLFELADRLRELRETKQFAEQELKDINAEIEEVDRQLSDMMVETETQNFTRQGMTFCLPTRTRASGAADRKDELYDMLREHGFGSLVYETVNANSLSAFVKEQVAENGDELPGWLNGLVNMFEQTTIGVRKASRG